MHRCRSRDRGLLSNNELSQPEPTPPYMTGHELQRILCEESNSLDWKAGGDPENIVETLAAFANDYEEAGTGRVLCGIKERIHADGSKTPEVAGISLGESKRIRDRVFGLSRSIVDPPITPQFDTYSLTPDKDVLVVSINTSSELHFFKNRVVVRLGDRTANASTQEQTELAQRKAHLDWLGQPCTGSTLDDINYFALEEISKGVKSGGDAKKFLQPGERMFGSAPPLTSRISGPNGDIIVPNRFAILLIGKDPHHFLPGAFVKLTRFHGLTRADAEFSSNEFFGPIPRLIEQVLEILDAEASMITDKTLDFASGAQNHWRYDRQALREILVNALAHRDYRDPLSTKIYVFQDRIEYENPGGFVKLLTIEEAKQGQTRWRNPSLARYLVSLKLAQETGTGIPVAIEATLEVSGKQPIFEVGAWFKVTVPAYTPPSRRHTEEVVSPEAGVLLISFGHGTINPAIVRRSLDAFREIADERIRTFHHSGFVTEEGWPDIIRQLRNWLRVCVEDSRFQEFHLFYRGPVAPGPLIGLIAASSKPLIVYFYDEDSSVYRPAYRLDRKLLQEP